MIDAGESGDQLGTLGLGDHRAVGALELAGRRIGVDGHQQPIGLLPRPLQISQVPDVEDVEQSVGQRDGLTLPAIGLEPLPRLADRAQLVDRRLHPRSS